MFKIRNKKTYVKHIRPRPNAKLEPVVSDNVLTKNTDKINKLAQVLKMEYNVVKKETPSVSVVEDDKVTPTPETTNNNIEEIVVATEETTTNANEEKVEVIEEASDVIQEEKPKQKRGRKSKNKKENNKK